jgi:undecaprenyl-diphosphatase
VEQAKPPESSGTVSEKVAESSQRIEQAAQASAPAPEKAANGIAQTAKEIVTHPGHERAALSEATQETLNPETQGEPDTHHPKQRELLRRAVIKRMKPLDALDAELFLLVNRLPHTQWLNAFFYSLTLIFTGGFSWYLMVITAILANPRQGLRTARDTVLPLTIATTLVEFPIKTFFRRRRPFIELIQAIVIGHKPGSWSFPSGHSAAAFAGALLLSRAYPERQSLNFLLAGMVAFSRVYLGDHYPGDVTSGALFGMSFAWVSRRVERLVLRLLGG